MFERHDFPSLEGTAVNFKFELLQASGSFKARGAFTHLLALDDAQRSAGVTCVSGGNHAVAVAYAAMRLGISAKVVVFRTANPARLALCRAYNAEIVLAGNGTEAFEIVRKIEAEEGRYFVHPFNGYHTVLGTATLGYEWITQTTRSRRGDSADRRRRSRRRRVDRAAAGQSPHPGIWRRAGRIGCHGKKFCQRITRSPWAPCRPSPIR